MVYSYGNKIKKYKLAVYIACMKKNSYIILIVNYLRREYLGELAADRRIMIKCILDK
jgi:hypothetical protein